jgi:hypothetical protein
VVDCEQYEPLNRPGPDDEPVTSRYLITWNLDADGGKTTPRLILLCLLVSSSCVAAIQMSCMQVIPAAGLDVYLLLACVMQLHAPNVNVQIELPDQFFCM